MMIFAKIRSSKLIASFAVCFALISASNVLAQSKGKTVFIAHGVDLESINPYWHNTTANYAISLFAIEQARAKGYQQVLWLDALERRYVEEVGAMNIGFVYEGKHIRTPALFRYPGPASSASTTLLSILPTSLP